MLGHHTSSPHRKVKGSKKSVGIHWILTIDKWARVLLKKHSRTCLVTTGDTCDHHNHFRKFLGNFSISREIFLLFKVEKSWKSSVFYDLFASCIPLRSERGGPKFIVTRWIWFLQSLRSLVINSRHNFGQNWPTRVGPGRARRSQILLFLYTLPVSEE